MRIGLLGKSVCALTLPAETISPALKTIVRLRFTHSPGRFAGKLIVERIVLRFLIVRSPRQNAVVIVGRV